MFSLGCTISYILLYQHCFVGNELMFFMCCSKLFQNFWKSFRNYFFKWGSKMLKTDNKVSRVGLSYFIGWQAN